jgi:hypothetical protein
LKDTKEELKSVRAKMKLQEIEAEESKSSSELQTLYWQQQYAKLKEENQRILGGYSYTAIDLVLAAAVRQAERGKPTHTGWVLLHSNRPGCGQPLAKSPTCQM